MRDARARAEQYAALTGVRLGPPLTIAESAHGAPPVYATRALHVSTAEHAPSTPVEPGEQTIRLAVQITYEIRVSGHRSRRREAGPATSDA